MTSWFLSLKGRLRRPNVGASSELRALRVIKIGHPWIDKLSASSSWLLVLFVFIVTSLPLPDRATWNVKGIVAILLAYSGYLLVLEVASRVWPSIYDLELTRIFRIGVNLLTVTALVLFSGSANSHFWFLYALPLLQANLYLRRTGITVVSGLTLVLLWTTSWLSSNINGIDSRHFGLQLTNSLTLLMLAAVIYWLFSATRDNRKQEAEVIESMRQTSLAIVEQLDHQSVLRVIIEQAVKMVDASGGGIYEYDPSKDELTVLADYGGPQSISGHRLKRGEGMAGRVVETGKPMIVEDYSVWPHRSPALEPDLFHAVVEVPLTLPNQIIGVMYATHLEKGPTFTTTDAARLSILAGHAAIAIKNAKIQNVAQLRLLHQVSSRLTYAASLAENLFRILSEAIKAMGVRDGSIMIFDPKTKTLEFKAWIVDGEKRDCEDHKKLGLDEGVAGRVASSRAPINCSDTEIDPRFKPSHISRGLRSILSVPIISDQNLLCIINVDSTEPDRFKPSDVELLTVLGTHSATMIASLRLGEVTRSLAGLPLKELNLKIVEGAFTLIGGDTASLFLTDHRGVAERVAIYPEKEGEHNDTPRETGLTYRILKTGNPEIISDVKNDNQVKPDLVERGIVSIIGVPLIDRSAKKTELQNQAFGVLFVSTKTRREFGESERQVLESLATQAASAITHARLNEAVGSERDFHKSLLDSAFDAIVAINTQGKVTQFNPSAEKLLGYARQEVENTDVGALYRERSDARMVQRLLQDPRNGDKLINHFTYARTKAGNPIRIRLSASRLPTGSVGFFREESKFELTPREAADRGERLPMIPEAQLKDLRGRIETSALGALDVLQADAVWIYYYNEEAQCFEPTPATFPLDAKAAPGPEIEQLLLAISNSDRPQFFETFTGDKPWHTAFANLTNICSIAGDGLKAKGRTIGIMICGYQTPQSFSEERQFRIRRYISDSAVQAAEQSEKTALLDGLYKMTLESTAEGSSRPGLQSVLDVAVKLTGAQYGALGIMSLGPQRQLRDFLVSGVDEKLKNELPHPVGKGLLGRLLDTDDCINEPDISNRDFGHPSHPKITSFLGTSILVDSKSVGNLYVGNKKDIGTFTEEDMTLLKILANWASETYQRSHSRQQVSTQEAITIATVMLSQLEQSAKDKGVKWSANLRKIADALEAGSRQVLNEIAVEAEKLATPISAFQEGLEARPSTQPLDDILAQLVSVKRQEQRDIRIDSEIEPACSVRGRELLLRIACEIPLENAIRSTRKANRIEVPIRISCKVSGRSPEPQFVVCTISDAGTGIPEKVKDRIFDEPFRYDDKNHDNSFIAGRIIQLHGGEISIIETGEAGTTVKFWFPLANK